MTVFFLIFIFWSLMLAAAKLGLSSIQAAKDNARIATGLTFIFTGATHFLASGKFMEMMPPIIPAPLLMIYASGFFEMLGGIGLIVPRTKRPSAYGLAALLLAVFPANIYVAVNHVQLGGFMNYSFYQWLRLPLQIVLIGWVLWFARAAGKPIR